jgi:hypothetical protein
MSVRGKGGATLKILLRKNKFGEYEIARGPRGIAKARNIVRKQAALRIELQHIDFQGAIPIYYARIPTTGFGGHPSHIQTEHDVARAHHNPPVVRPALAHHHWKDDDAHPTSWPAAYVRSGAAGGPHARGLTAFLVASRGRTPFNGQRDVRAVGNNGISTNVVTVNFGVIGMCAAAFTLQNVPATVRCLSGQTLRWEHSPVGANQWTDITTSTHTLYILDETPLAAVGAGEQHYFEVVDWACRWADSFTGRANVITQIWNCFNPVAANHATGFFYWKNHQANVPPAQNVGAAIRYQDQGLQGRRASSCIVFDRLFLNCLAVHGIRTAEVKLSPEQYVTVLLPNNGLTGFYDGGTAYYFNPTAWNATTNVGHGNALAPDVWQSHWVAAVLTNNGPSNWELYDPSYGLAPYALAAAPVVGNAIAIPQPYEAAAVQHFPCTRYSADGVNLDLLFPTVNVPSANPNPPHLRGDVLDGN